MALRLGDEAPNFTIETTEGTINFHEYLGNSWGILFSHPKDYTPVCTTELGYVSKIKNEFGNLKKSEIATSFKNRPFFFHSKKVPSYVGSPLHDLHKNSEF